MVPGMFFWQTSHYHHLHNVSQIMPIISLIEFENTVLISYIQQRMLIPVAGDKARAKR